MIDLAGMEDRVARAGLTPGASAALRRRYETAATALNAGGARDQDRAAWFVPGRIEVLGKHTDYCGGRSLLGATERGFVVVVAPRADSAVRVRDAVSGEECALDLRQPTGALTSGEAHSWHTYPAAVVRRLARNFPGATQGADVAFASDLPPASGLSSSSALIIAMSLALLHVNDLESNEIYQANVRTPEDLAGYLATMENGAAFGTLGGETGVGTFGGSQDHTAILCCRNGTLSQYAFAPTRFEGAVPLPAGHVFAVCMSGVVAVKTGSARDAYNRASLSARTVLDVWNRASGRGDTTLAAACESSEDAVVRIHDVLDAAPAGPFPAALLHARVQQFVDESSFIIPSAAAALRRADLPTFGALVDRSQAGAERGLGNQTEETLALARLAREEGAVAASAFGAGFGGSVWALVADGDAALFVTRWRQRYLARFPGRSPTFFRTGAAPGAMRL